MGVPIKIFVDQGHNPGLINAGASGNGIFEQEVNYMVGIYLVNILNEDPRFEARASRTTPDTVLGTNLATSLAQRVRMANSWQADYFISIHSNASENPSYNGTEAYVYSRNSQPYYLAEYIVNDIVRRVGTKNNGVLVNTSLFVLRRTAMPAVLIELGYVTNAADAEKLANDQYQFAYGIYNGLLNYLGLPQL